MESDTWVRRKDGKVGKETDNNLKIRLKESTSLK